MSRTRTRVWSRVLAAGTTLTVLACMERAQPTAPADAAAGPHAAVASQGATALNAVVEFGRPDVGSTFPPPDGHDASPHAKDMMNPRTVVIAVGGTVTFRVPFPHRPAVYDVGTMPDDIEVSPATLKPLSLGAFFQPNFVIDDPTNRLWQGSYSLAPQEVTSPPFTHPGRYLVICTTVPHFVANNMYAWVIVQ